MNPVTWSKVFPHWDLPARIPSLLDGVLSLAPRDEAERVFAERIEREPKIELHVHMEAAVPASFYAALNERSHLFTAEELPSRRAPFKDLGDFIKAWVDQTRLIEDAALLAELARAFCAGRKAQNIVYSEVHISPIDFSLVRDRFKVQAKVLGFEEALRGYLAGLKRGLAEHPGIEVRLIVDALWVSTDDECRHILDVLERVLADRTALDAQGVPLIAAIGMGGPEVSALAPKKKWFVDEVRKLGLKVDLHSGESSSPEDHRFGFEILKPDRIGHGISGARAKDPFFFEGPIAACPTSNLITGSFSGPLAAHPITQMRERGGLVSVNTDDPLLFGPTLTLEWVALRHALGWGVDDFLELRRQAAASALMPQVLARVVHTS